MTEKFRMNWYGKSVKGKVKEAAVQGLRDAAEHVLEQANRTAPIDEGTLRRSGTTSVDEEDLVAAVSYDTPYAGYLHEGQNMLFQDPNARTKWLELTIQERQEAINNYLAEAIRGAIR